MDRVKEELAYVEEGLEKFDFVRSDNYVIKLTDII